MKVKLLKDWFAHNGQYYRKGEHDFPASFKDHLPPRSEILDGKGAEPKGEAKAPVALAKGEAKAPVALAKGEAKAPVAPAKGEAKAPVAPAKGEAKAPVAPAKGAELDAILSGESKPKK